MILKNIRSNFKAEKAGGPLPVSVVQKAPEQEKDHEGNDRHALNMAASGRHSPRKKCSTWIRRGRSSIHPGITPHGKETCKDNSA